MDNFIENKFPTAALVPKNENGALNFITKYPEYNGKGVTIAIFDSGVDPKVNGLRVRQNDMHFYLCLPKKKKFCLTII